MTPNAKSIQKLAIKLTIWKLRKEKHKNRENEKTKDDNSNLNPNSKTNAGVANVLHSKNRTDRLIRKKANETKDIRFASLNPDNASCYKSREKIAEKLEYNNIDIACIQETHDNSNADTAIGNYIIIRSSEGEKEINKNAGYPIAGVAIYVNKSLKCNVQNVIKIGGRYMQMTLEGENFPSPVIIVNTYAPTMGYTREERAKYWNIVNREMKKKRGNGSTYNMGHR